MKPLGNLHIRALQMLGLGLMLMLLLSLACAPAEAPEPVVIEKEVQVEKEVIKEVDVIKEVPVEKEVIKDVEAVKEVEVVKEVELVAVPTPVPDAPAVNPGKVILMTGTLGNARFDEAKRPGSEVFVNHEPGGGSIGTLRIREMQDRESDL